MTANGTSLPIQTLPPLPAPPHDPLTLLLDGRVGWRGSRVDRVEPKPGTGDLALVPVAGAGPDLADPSGSLGGVVAPAVVAVGPRGAVYLLARGSAEVLVFDPCECRFMRVPCVGRIGKGARDLADPQAIAICNSNLMVTDFGNGRVSVFSLNGFVLRDHWRPPTAEPFAPFGIAVDGNGRVFVTDPVNLRIHRFGATGRWEKSFAAPGVPRHLAIDCRNRLYVLIDGRTDVTVLDGEGAVLGVEDRADRIRGAFPPLPFRVLAGGRLDLSEQCAATGTAGVFDLQGKPAAGSGSTGITSYPTPVLPEIFSGRYWSSALDSEFFNCQWHRVVVCACVPEGTSLRIATHTASAILTQADVEDLPEYAWQSGASLRPSGSGLWDCLVLSGPGRYLWLRVDFISNGKATPAIRRLSIEFPRISLRRYLPAVFGENARAADFTDRMLAVFDTTFRSIESQLDCQARLYDPRSSPASDNRSRTDFLSYLASWIGIAVDRNWPEQRRRDFVAAAARQFPIRGTPEGLRQLLLAFLGIGSEGCPGGEMRTVCVDAPANCRPPVKACLAWEPPRLLLEHFQLRRWMFLGAGRLGDQAMVWGNSIVNRSQFGTNAQVGRSQLVTTPDPYRDPFHVYAHKFSVFVPAARVKAEAERRALSRLINQEKPAHTGFQLELVEPRFRVGVQATIGLDAVVGRYPAGVKLDQAALGRGTVLSEGPHRARGPRMTVGRNARIGETSALG